MSSLNGLCEFKIRDATSEELDGAIGLVLSGVSATEGYPVAQVEDFLAYLQAQNLKVDWSLIVTRQETIVGACLGVISPGKAAMVLLSASEANSSLCTQLANALRMLEARSRKADLSLLQALMPPGATGQARCAELAGYKFLTDLSYMSLEVKPFFSANSEEPELTIECCRLDRLEELNDTLEKTYINSLDCPDLNNIRTTAETIKSHRASGIHDSKLWFLARDETQPVGILLLTKVPLRQALEIVYLGTIPQARGKGYGKKLVQHAIKQTLAAKCTHLILAVDTMNHFARKIYQSLGFLETDIRSAWIRAL